MLSAGVWKSLPVTPLLPSGQCSCCSRYDGIASAASSGCGEDAADPRDLELVAASPGVEACRRCRISAASGRCDT
jgi:hypothetical protein